VLPRHDSAIASVSHGQSEVYDAGRMVQRERGDRPGNHVRSQGELFKAVPLCPARVQHLPGYSMLWLTHQSSNRRVLAWDEYASRPKETPAFDSLRERSKSTLAEMRNFADHTVELSQLTELRLQTGCAVNSRSPNLISKLSFSLMSREDSSLLDLDAIHAAQLAEWTDGIRVLRGEGDAVMKETASYIHTLTELALKVRLLDITGDRVDVPEKVAYSLRES
jgi:hypothetical protein